MLLINCVFDKYSNIVWEQCRYDEEEWKHILCSTDFHDKGTNESEEHDWSKHCEAGDAKGNFETCFLGMLES